MEVEQLKRECEAMLASVKQLQQEESELILQNQILAREALTNGYWVESVIKSQPKQGLTKKRKKRVAIKPTDGDVQK
jgi:hypothetical protein